MKLQTSHKYFKIPRTTLHRTLFSITREGIVIQEPAKLATTLNAKSLSETSWLASRPKSRTAASQLSAASNFSPCAMAHR